MERHTKDKKHSFKPSKYADRWGTKEYKEDQDPVAKRAARKRWRNTHRRESSWVSVSTPLEDLVSLSPRMKISRRCLFAFHVDDKYSKLFDDSSDEKGSKNKSIEEEEKIACSPSLPDVAPFIQESPRLHEQKHKQGAGRHLEETMNSQQKEDSEDSFTTISTDIQNAIHNDLLENEINNT